MTDQPQQQPHDGERSPPYRELSRRLFHPEATDGADGVFRLIEPVWFLAEREQASGGGDVAQQRTER